MAQEFADVFIKLMIHHLADIDLFLAVSQPFFAQMVVPYCPISSKVSRFRRETLHGRLKERLQPSENDRVLKNGLSSSKPDYFSHSGPQGAEGGHHEEVGSFSDSPKRP